MFPYFVEVPDTPKSVSFIEKDSKRFPDTSGWGYARFLYDAASDIFKPYRSDSSFAKKDCFQCHYDCNGKRLRFHELPPEVNGSEGNAPLGMTFE